MSVSEVSKRYARALYELAKAGRKNDLIISELRALRSAFRADVGLCELLASPIISPEQKVNAIRVAVSGKTSEETFNTLMLLGEKNRLDIFSDLVSAYEEISDEDHGVTRGTVRSAATLSPEARKRIEETVTTVTGKKVILNFTEDSKLLGGMIAQVGGWTFDDSLESHLTKLSEDLNRRAN